MERVVIKPSIFRAKRVFDMVVGFALLVLFSPIFILAMLLIILEHILRGSPFDPLFYLETRISRGKPFQIIKFNIFRHDEVLRLRKKGTLIQTKTLENDGAVIYIGLLLKQIYFDELPQLINVLRGDMGIVGPRPLNENAYQKALGQKVVALKHIKAGITGNFQCYKDIKGKTMKELDDEYLRHVSQDSYFRLLLIDCKILYRTMKFVLRAKGI